MSTAELLRTRELRAAEVLATQVREELDAAFRSLVTVQQLIKALNTTLLEGGNIEYARPEHEAQMMAALGRMDAVEELDVWEIENAGSGAATIADLLSRARHKRDGDDA